MRNTVLTIVVLFGLPALALIGVGGWALWGEAQLLEEQLERQALKIADRIVVNSLRPFDESVAALIDKLENTESAKLEKELTIKKPWIEDVLILSEDFIPLIPPLKPTIESWSEAASRYVMVTSIAGTAHELEREGEYEKSIEAYTIALKKAGTASGQGVILLGKARSHLYFKQYKEAHTTFKELAKKQRLRLPSGLPAVYVGAVGMIKANLAAQRSPMEGIESILEAMLEGRMHADAMSDIWLLERVLTHMSSEHPLRPHILKRKKRLSIIERVSEADREWVNPGYIALPGSSTKPPLAIRRVPGSPPKIIVVVVNPQSLTNRLKADLKTHQEAALQFSIKVGPVKLPNENSVVHQLGPLFQNRAVFVTKADLPLLDKIRTRQDYTKGVALVVFAMLLLAGMIWSLRAMARQAELQRIKAEFVASVSHELRTPLTSIRTMAEVLTLERAPSREREQEYFAAILTECDRLTRLVENVLDASRLEQGTLKVVKKPVNVVEFINEVVDSYRPILDNKGFDVEVEIADGLPEMLLDRHAMFRAVTNLLSNAVKYSTGDKWVRVAVEQVGDTLVIHVADRGIGIAPEHIEKVFDRFYRVDLGTDVEIRGVGLGLALVREIAVGHGGTVTVESTPGEGSTFTIRVPV